MTNQNEFNILGLPCSKIELDFFNDQRSKGMSRALALRLVLQSREDVNTISEAPVNPLINLFK